MTDSHSAPQLPADDDHYLRVELYRLIREASETFEFLQSGSLDGIWYWDLEQPEHEWMSPRFWQILGYDPADMPHLADAWKDLIHPEDLPRCVENFEAHCHDPAYPYDQVVRYRHRLGWTVWVRCRGLAIRNDAGQPVRMLGAHNDLTEMHRSMLREQMLANVQAQILDLDSPAEFSHAIRGKWLAELRACDVSAHNMSMQLPGSSPGTFSSDIGAFLGQTHKVGLDLTPVPWVREAWDTQRPIQVPKSRWGDRFAPEVRCILEVPFSNGGSLGVSSTQLDEFPAWQVETVSAFAQVVEIGLFRLMDIEAISRAKQEAEGRAQELERSNKELQHFAYVASHDLQEPLRMVTSYLQLLSRRYKGQLDSDADEFIGFAVDGAERMRQLIADILAYSRVQSNAAEPEPVDLEQTWQAVKGNLQAAIADAGASVTHSTVPAVKADPAQVLQLLQNLLANAIKFRGDEPPVVKLTARTEADMVVVSVTDNGMGIDPARFERIFEMFGRAVSRKYPGTGIGLAICKRIVERHGGRMSVESTPGAGATFTFTLPAAT